MKEMHHLATRIHGAFRASMHPTSLPMTNSPDTSRIDALEFRIAHQDATIEELNAAVTEQWKLIDRLERRISALNERVAEAEASAGSAPAANKPPPHY